MKRARLILAASIDPSAKVPTFATTAYTGGLLPVDGYSEPVVVDLAGLVVADRVIANLRHDREQVVGHASEIENDKSRLVIRGALSYPGDARDELLATAAGQFPLNASIEVRPLSEPRMVRAGETVRVNGQEIAGPAWLVSRGELYGVAFVPFGADEQTSVSIAARAAKIVGAKSMDFASWVASLGLSVDALSDAQRAELTKAYEAIAGGVTAAEGEDPEKVAASMDEEKPVDAKVKASRASTWDAADIRAAYADQLDALDAKILEVEDDAPAALLATVKKDARKALGEIKAKAAKSRWSADRFNGEAAKILARAEVAVIRGARPTAPAIHASTKDFSGNVIEAALCQSAKVPGHERQYDDKTLQAAHSAYRGRLGLQRVLIMAAAANGMQWSPGERLSTANLRDVLRHAFTPVHAGPATVSVSRILENVANKELLAGYESVDNTWREISQVKPVVDFKTHTAYRLLDDMEYEELALGGKIKNGRIGDEVIERRAKTYAKMFSLDRQTIINDDLSAFDDLRNRLGRGAAIKFSNLFWSTFMNNAAFFTSGNTNYIDGATTNLGTDGVGLGLGVKAFRKMTSPTADGAKRMGMNRNPSILLVPPELEGVAEALYKNQNLAAVKTSDANIYANKYRPVVVSHLSESAFTGNSSTAWYLLGDPQDLPAMHVAFLDGQENPTVESADADFDQLGIVLRGYHDFGMTLAEYLCGVKSKGAA